MHKHAVSAVSDTFNTGKAYSVLKEVHVDGTKDALLVCGDQIGRGRCMWVEVTAANTAAQKDAVVVAALNA